MEMALWSEVQGLSRAEFEEGNLYQIASSATTATATPISRLMRVGQREDNRVFVEFSARGKQPDTAEPEDHERHDEPEQNRVPVELCHVVAADVDGKDDYGRKGAGGAEAAQLIDIGQTGSRGRSSAWNRSRSDSPARRIAWRWPGKRRGIRRSCQANGRCACRLRRCRRAGAACRGRKGSAHPRAESA